MSRVRCYPLARRWTGCLWHHVALCVDPCILAEAEEGQL